MQLLPFGWAEEPATYQIREPHRGFTHRPWPLARTPGPADSTFTSHIEPFSRKMAALDSAHRSAGDLVPGCTPVPITVGSAATPAAESSADQQVPGLPPDLSVELLAGVPAAGRRLLRRSGE